MPLMWTDFIIIELTTERIFRTKNHINGIENEFLRSVSEAKIFGTKQKEC